MFVNSHKKLSLYIISASRLFLGSQKQKLFDSTVSNLNDNKVYRDQIYMTNLGHLYYDKL